MPRQRESMKPWTDLNRTSINNFRQNKPSYVVEDVLNYFSMRFGDGARDKECYDATWQILLARGVLKWMSMRRALIMFKLMLKARIRDHQQQIQQKKEDLGKLDNMNRRGMAKYGKVSAYHLGYLRGSLASTELIYKSIRKICHSMRWQTPDNDLRNTPFWISQHSYTGKELLTDVHREPKKPLKNFMKLKFLDWTKMKVGDEAEFSCSVCRKVGKHKLAGIKRQHDEISKLAGVKQDRTFEWPIWICPGDVEEVELACFKCGSVEMYGPADPRLCRCGAIPVGWNEYSKEGQRGACERCNSWVAVAVVLLGDELVCARCSYHDQAGSWFGTWIKLFFGNE